MDQTKFEVTGVNDLQELSEIRLELVSDDEQFQLMCRLGFGKMLFEHDDRSYEVGVSIAFLRLSFEGCETTLGDRFGESVLEAVKEEHSLETTIAIGIDGSVGVDAGAGIVGRQNAGGQVAYDRTRKETQTRSRLPVFALPNNSWRVQPETVTGSTASVIEGTAMPNAFLCAVRRRAGGNRLAIAGEVQIPKMAIKVHARGGNRLGKSLSEWQNKDAIIGQILKRALERENSNSSFERSSSAIVISRQEISEKL